MADLQAVSVAYTPFSELQLSGFSGDFTNQQSLEETDKPLKKNEQKTHFSASRSYSKNLDKSSSRMYFLACFPVTLGDPWSLIQRHSKRLGSFWYWGFSCSIWRISSFSVG